MYTSKDEYFYFRPRSECSGNILPVRVEDAESDPSAVVRALSYEDVLYFYELAITKIGLFRWAEDGFRSPSGIRGERNSVALNGLGFPFPGPESGLDLGDMAEFPPYVPPRRVLLPDEPTQVASGSASDLDPFGPAFGDPGLSDGPVGMLSLLRDAALCGPYPPYSGSSCRRFAWDDVEFDASSGSESWDDPSERIDRGGYYVDPASAASAHRAPFPASAVPDTGTDLLWSSSLPSRTEGGYAEWFGDALGTGRWLRDRAEEAGLSLLEEMRAVPFRQELAKRMWLDLLYFDSVAVHLVPAAPFVSSARSESYNSDGEFSWPEVQVSTSRSGGDFTKTFTLVGDFGYGPGGAEPVTADTPAAERGPGSVEWSFSEAWSAYRTYVACCAATSWSHVAGMNGAVPAPSLDQDACAGEVYLGMEAESYSAVASARVPARASRSSFEVPLPAFPSDQLPFDPDLVDEVRGYVTCYWRGAAAKPSAYGAVDRERGDLEVPADPLTGGASGTRTWADELEPPLPPDSPGRYVSWGCGWFSAPASVELDLGEDGSAPVLRVSSGAMSSAIAAAESAGRCSIPSSGSVPGLSYDPLDLVPVPVDGYGRDYPNVVASFSGGSFDADPGAPGDSLAEEYEKCYASLPAGYISAMLASPFAYCSDPSETTVVAAAARTGRTVECQGYGGANGVTPDPSAGWTTGGEFGLTEYVWGHGTQPCVGTTPYPGFNCVEKSAGRATAGSGSSVSAVASVTGLWLFIRFKPKCAAEIALDALRESCEGGS